MKKYIIIAIVIIAIILFFLFCKDETMEYIVNPQNESETATEETPAINPITETKPSVTTPSKSTPIPPSTKDNGYSYVNNTFNFSVDLPKLVATERTDLPEYISTIVVFGVGDQSKVEEQKRIPNSMTVYIWNDSIEFKNMFETGTELPQEKINGVTFNVRSFTNEDMTSYRYSTVINNLTYDIGVLNKSDITKFHLAE